MYSYIYVSDRSRRAAERSTGTCPGTGLSALGSRVSRRATQVRGLDPARKVRLRLAGSRLSRVQDDSDLIEDGVGSRESARLVSLPPLMRIEGRPWRRRTVVHGSGRWDSVLLGARMRMGRPRAGEPRGPPTWRAGAAWGGALLLRPGRVVALARRLGLGCGAACGAWVVAGTLCSTGWHYTAPQSPTYATPHAVRKALAHAQMRRRRPRQCLLHLRRLTRKAKRFPLPLKLVQLRLNLPPLALPRLQLPL